jgi:hypothetical protein
VNLEPHERTLLWGSLFQEGLAEPIAAAGILGGRA